MGPDKALLKEVTKELWRSVTKLRPDLNKDARMQLVLKGLITIGDLPNPIEAAMVVATCIEMEEDPSEPKEGITLRALSNSLSDEDGIASINIGWEKSKDGRNWVALNSLSGPILKLDQVLVGSQVRARVAVVDNFGIETNLYSQATRTVENVNNKPSGRIVIRRVGQ